MSIFTRLSFNFGSIDKIKMDMREMERMILLLSQAAQRVEQTGQVIQESSKLMEGGAMLGQAGTALTDGLKSRMSPSIASLVDTVRAAERYCRDEMVDLQQAMAQNKQRHGT
jgi:hypothetical protein